MRRENKTSTGAGADESKSPAAHTAELLLECRSGSLKARDALVRRFLPKMQRWAKGRLPQYARDVAATEDLVQNTFIRALDHVENFDAQREGAFLAYLRQIFINQLRDEVRRHVRRPAAEPLTTEPTDDHRSILEAAIGVEALEAYDQALQTLPATDQQAIVMRLEFGYQYTEIAADLGLTSANAARMRITRAIGQLAKLIDHEQLRP